MTETIIVLDFGGQYNQLIARRVREANVYSEILPYTASIERILSHNPSGIIFTGGPKSVYADDAPIYDKRILKLGIPILGICYGAQLISFLEGGTVESAKNREYGHTEVIADGECILFDGLDEKQKCWMSHTDQITKIPPSYQLGASSKTCKVCCMYDKANKIYAVQYHPEVNHTTNGQRMLENFIYKVCKCKGDWTMSNIADRSIKQLKEKIGEKKVLLALSGGVDSSVVAVMLSKAIGKNLYCIFVDHGLLRKDEGDQVEALFTKHFDLNFIRVNAQERFLKRLDGVSDPEKKRKIIGKEFIKVFEEESKKLGHMHFLAQGTIYPDVVESGEGHAAIIKSHHNVGGLPEHVDFEEIIEPLRDLFKDEVRAVGMELGLDEELVWRQPFPGPGLAIRIMGSITKQKLEILREADFIYREEIKKAGLHREIWQYFAALTDTKTVGVMGDERTYEHLLALRAVTSIDAMTADWARIPHDVLARISNRIINEVPHINRIVYDITSKPPGTIEWE